LQTPVVDLSQKTVALGSRRVLLDGDDLGLPGRFPNPCGALQAKCELFFDIYSALMTLQTIEIETAPKPQTTVIVLHGLGADGHDFAPICEELDLSALGGVRFVLPHAPERPVTLNGGMVMRSWYDIYGLESINRIEDTAGMQASCLQINELMARELARGVPASRIVLMGFSQGCAMTLYAGLRYPKSLAGLVALSGYLPLADRAAADRHVANAQTPIFMAHGQFDPVVAFAFGSASRDVLQALQQPVQWHEYPMPHAVCPQEIQDLNRWLLKTLQTA
jgi:phospholipase/carboxylesterase